MTKAPFFILLFISALLTGCSQKIDKEEARNATIISTGSANLKNTVCIGDGFMGGFTNHELYRSGQRNSLANILGEILTKKGSNTFNTPLMFDDIGLGQRWELALVEDCNQETSLSINFFNRDNNILNDQNISVSGPFNNLGIPKLKLRDAFTTDAGGENPYYNRISESGSTYWNNIRANNATFFVSWLGMQDFLDWTLKGGTFFSGTGSFMTSETDFNLNYRNLFDSLFANGIDHGVLLNLFDPFDSPYFKTLPYDTLTLTQQQATQLNLIYALNPNVIFREGRNAFVVQEPGLARQMTEGEFILFTPNIVDSIKCENYGSLNPFSTVHTITLSEKFNIKSRIRDYNNIIDEIGVDYGIPVLNVNEIFNQLYKDGFSQNGITVNSQFITGNFFSVDGLSLTPRGNAVIANEIVKVVNLRYGTNLPIVNISNYPGNIIPNLE